MRVTAQKNINSALKKGFYQCAKAVEANERAKRAYVHYLEQAKGLDEKSTDKVLAALVKFEQSTGFKPFKRFHIEQPSKFKTDLAKTKGRATRLQVKDHLQRHRVL